MHHQRQLLSACEIRDQLELRSTNCVRRVRRHTNAHQIIFNRPQLVDLRLQLLEILRGQLRVRTKRLLVNNSTQPDITQRLHTHQRRITRITNTRDPRSHCFTRAPRRRDTYVVRRHQLEPRHGQLA